MNLDLNSQDLSAWLADAALQSTVILAIVGGFVMLRPSMSAARRHFLLATALMTVPALMLCGGFAPMWRPFGEAVPVSRVTLHDEPTVRTTIYPDGRQIEDPFSSAAPAPIIAKPSALRSNIWPLIWLGGIGFGLLVLLKAAHDLCRLRRASTAESDARLLHIFHETQRGLNVTLPDSTMRRSARCVVPMTWGWRRNTVMLPGNADGWSDARIQLVLRHELAHIARGDVLVTFLTTLSALLVWFHPLAWLMWRACNQAREQACDDLALQHTESSRENFADELLAAVTDLGGFQRCILPLALAMAASPRARAMKSRLASILDEARDRTPWKESQRMTWVLATVAAAFALSGLTACRTFEVATGHSNSSQIWITTKVLEITTKGSATTLADLGLSHGDGAGLQMVGIHDEKTTADLVNKLSRQKGVDLMSAPSVTTRSKHMARVEIVREFIFPSEFEPPKLRGNPSNLTEIKGGVIKLPPGGSIACSPTTPTAFEMKKVGIQMQVVPEIMGDGSIDLQIEPQITEFEGFKNWGEPITAKIADAHGKIEEFVLTENKIQQPIFNTRKISTNVSLPDGHTVIFGGLMRTDVDDKSNEKSHRHVFFIVRAKVLKP